MTDASVLTLKLDPVQDQARSAVEHLARTLHKDLAENLQSLTVVGSALTADFHPQRSDINTVLVVGRRSHDLLRLIASYGNEMGQRKLRAPVLMTQEYLQSSLDVFSVELLDYQLNHATVYGDDPLASLSFNKEHVRLQCERELKSALIQLRQGYIRSLGKPKLVGELLLGSLSGLLPLWRAMLWLADTERPKPAQETIRAAAKQWSFDAGAFEQLAQARRDARRPDKDRVEGLFESVYQIVDQLSRTVDQMSVTEK